MRSNSQDDISNTQQPIKSLFDDRVFITLFLSGLVLSVISAAAIIYASSLTFCLQAECFNNALSVFKFPIGIATAGITLSGLYALAHRSQQTAIQIRKTEEQIAKADAALQETKSNNTYSNYLRHRDDCIAGFNSIAMKLRCEIRDPEKLYSLIFPENSPFSFSHRSSMGADGYFINNTLSKYQAMTNYLEEASDLSNTPIHAQLVQSKLNELLSELQFFVKNSGFKTIKDKHFFRDIENTD